MHGPVPVSPRLTEQVRMSQHLLNSYACALELRGAAFKRFSVFFCCLLGIQHLTMLPRISRKSTLLQLWEDLTKKGGTLVPSDISMRHKAATTTIRLAPVGVQ